MKTAVSLPDEVFEDAERLARRLKMSRSAFFAEAVAEYVARHEPEGITEALNRIADDVDTRLEPLAAASARRTLLRSEWTATP
ncbi:MAG: ribbon-helix-helix protein, CopG family [Anaeromyxobacteraceae bacterium]